MGVEGGVETATHFRHAALTDGNLNYVGFSADQKNTFNICKRAHMLRTLYGNKSLAPL